MSQGPSGVHHVLPKGCPHAEALGVAPDFSFFTQKERHTHGLSEARSEIRALALRWSPARLTQVLGLRLTSLFPFLKATGRSCSNNGNLEQRSHTAARGPDVACRHVLFGSLSVLKVGIVHMKDETKQNGLPASHERLEAVTAPGPHSGPATIRTGARGLHPTEAGRGGSGSFTHLRIHVGTWSEPGAGLVAGKRTGKAQALSLRTDITSSWGERPYARK